jgi:hypothetical protein
MVRFIKKTLYKRGLQISRNDTHTSKSYKHTLSSLLPNNKGNYVIFDVGAFTGENSKEYRALYSQSQIYSFEPFIGSYSILKGIGLSNFEHFNFGFSDKKSTERFNLNKGSATNSLLGFQEGAQEVWRGMKGCRQKNLQSASSQP